MSGYLLPFEIGVGAFAGRARRCGLSGPHEASCPAENVIGLRETTVPP